MKVWNKTSSWGRFKEYYGNSLFVVSRTHVGREILVKAKVNQHCFINKMSYLI